LFFRVARPAHLLSSSSGPKTYILCGPDLGEQVNMNG
jgi:hypothetical protein